MKIVAVSQRVDYYPERDETRDALDQRLAAFVAACGFMPVAVPNTLGEAIHEWLSFLKPAAVLLSGGNDIGQFSERDDTEAVLLNYAHKRHMPVLGICRGMQMLAHWSGVELHPVQGHAQTRHRLAGEIVGEVNSYHRFSLATCPVGFEVIARSEDGEVEAIRQLSLPWEGWMWHPEREERFVPRDVERLKRLFS